MRRGAFVIALGALVLIATVVASEVASRAVRLFVCEGRGGGLHTPDPQYGWVHRAGVRVESHACIGRRYEFRVTVETNSKGLRDREYAYERPAGTARVVVLGDSVVEAAQVKRDEAFTEILEARLGTAQMPVEVLNMGVAGYSTHNQLLLYRGEGRKYRPGIVVSQFNLENDAGEISPDIHRREYAGPDALPTAGVSVDAAGDLQIDTSPYRRAAEESSQRQAQGNRLDAWLTRNLYVYRRIHGMLSGPAVDVTAPPQTVFPGFGVYLEPPPPEWETAWAYVAASYRLLAREVAADGGSLVVAIVPSSQIVSEERWQRMLQWALGRPPDGHRWDREAPRRRITTILGDLGIPFLDVTDAMREALAATGRTGFFETDPHPDAQGHRVIAGAFEPFLRERLGALRPAK